MGSDQCGYRETDTCVSVVQWKQKMRGGEAPEGVERGLQDG